MSQKPPREEVDVPTKEELDNQHRLGGCNYPHEFVVVVPKTVLQIPMSRCVKCCGRLPTVDARHYMNGVKRCPDLVRRPMEADE